MVNKYWTLKYLINILKKNPDQKVSVVVNSVAVNGTAMCTIRGYTFSSGTLKYKKDSDVPKIGDVIDDCKITNILPVEGVLELEHDV